MAARTRKVQLDDRHKAKIRASQLENRLVRHVLKDEPMSRTQVAAALGVLKKYKPDMHQSEVTHNTGKITELTDQDIVARLSELGIVYQGLANQLTDKPIDPIEQSDTKH